MAAEQNIEGGDASPGDSMSTETRFIIFTVLAGLILVGSLFYQAVWNPQPQEADVAEVEDENAEKEDEPGENGDPQNAEPADPDTSPQEPSPPPVVIEPQPDVDPLPDGLAPRWLTLGSYDPESGYRILVTLTSQGGAIERVEMNSPRFRDLDDFSGYIGYLALTTDTQELGCRVNVVPGGTPAETAGIRGPQFDEQGIQTSPGDLIIAIGDDPTPDAQAFNVLLSRSHPGDALTLKLKRVNEEGVVETIERTATLAALPAQVIRPEIEMRPDAVNGHPLSFGLTVSQLGDTKLQENQSELPGHTSLYNGIWQSQYIDGGTGVEFSILLSKEDSQDPEQTGLLRLVRRYRLKKLSDEAGDDSQAYHLVMEMEIENLRDQPQDIAYRLRGPTGLPLEGWWFGYRVHPTRFTGAGTRDVIWQSAGEEGQSGEHRLITCGQIVKHADKAEENGENPTLSLLDDEDSHLMFYAGCDAQYFTVALLANDLEKGEPTPEYSLARAVLLGEEDELRKTRSAVTFRLDSQLQSLAPRGAADGSDKFTQSFTLFVGPKQPKLLDKYGLEDVVVYGWPIIRMVAKPMQSILHFLYGILKNYGIAIIVLTVMVRGLLSPLGRKVAMDSKRMQELRPELDKIKEKFKNDSPKLMEAQRELMRKNKCNPMSGCFLMFFQLPIFIGLYRALSVDIELRGAPLMEGVRWCSNLAAPDMLFRWESMMKNIPLLGKMCSEGGMLGPYFNILPLFTVALFLAQQKLLTPPATTDEQRMQQKMMSFMTLFIGFMFFKVPAGLCIYFITSSLWGIAERKLLPSGKKNKDDSTTEETPRPERKTSQNGAAKRAAQVKRKKKKGKKK